MGKIFTLTDDIKQIARDAIDDLIDELGKDCTLLYPPKTVHCANCVFDPIGKKSSGRYLTGGPVFFPVGSLCPLCNGAGTRAEQVSEVVRFLCAWTPQDFYMPVPRGITVPEGRIQTKGYMTDFPKVMQCVEMIVENPLEPVLRARFKLVGEPVDRSNIIQGRYFVARWERAG